ncbi:precorrin-2 dehydrogenase/sirohydrochlorin ferrochelatase family protein [Vagococcus carniphilus]|uniref:precorrin-2 dehydrogenase n=1 Tax=Vagococcus carniphilus TaxID=218144 RepID=A0AAW8TZG2_9ENTE|nr:bifunctional precorrin-2 dehydrogenase/sirohydrochlorin ferrochelatase [Vagococcus carniphilus]MDT2814460.1 bifunctional precorrin-2 dehydrogenase/sirohydrochlorin ferrochelatase [Vagococcus carniphilus]MDT2830527.1 bifunctional precorrin-2 dehydrogenase/sirohydrochlorin ferrochelatase [Vagococcus carniphilus]MDT2832573.1 bifunctional precorrin-2 dehydrogenase/sirohydrochlorin ferrochelatase [Vagococcus carniphilus]MDT2839825.1 bifunctional precorrin-2 dehydrogenase/sirohydrochlorin ferroche
MYPITVNLKNKEVLIVGGGKIAARKVKGLISEDAIITIISPTLDEGIDATKVTWIQKKYETGDIFTSASLIFACTDDKPLNEQILEEALPSQIVNVVSNKEISEFYNMSMIKHDGLKIGISTEGASPLVAKKTRIELQEWLENK